MNYKSLLQSEECRDNTSKTSNGSSTNDIVHCSSGLVSRGSRMGYKSRSR